jgi:(1->4)-alpha-D-glucan 1-alpha-D-glucosylmutase
VIPSATYRLQLHAGFTFRDATALVPYLADLGVSHVYSSPILRARPGSRHGYDIIDHNAFNPEIGTAEDFAAFVSALRARGLGLIVDFVPNHMGIGSENRWWLDVLEWGEASPYAAYFDIDWRPLRDGMRGKVLLPFLGEPYGQALSSGHIVLGYDRPAGFALRYFEHRFPLAPATYASLLADASNPELAVVAGDFERLSLATQAEVRAAGRELVGRLAELAEQPDVVRTLETIVERFNADPQRLDALILQQHFRLAYWRVAGDEINYRRFFDINSLAALRIENAQCFADTHQLIFELLSRGDVDGLRIDHIDGLFDPIGYCDLLRSRSELLGHEPYLVVEKILARHETLRERWRIDGTTGYEYLALITGLLINADAEARVDRIYKRFTGRGERFAEAAYSARRFVMKTALAGELNVLAQGLDRIAQADVNSRDFTLLGLRRALQEVIACFPVYRTYARTGEMTDDDRRDIDWAIGLARKYDRQSEPSVYDFIGSVLKSPAGRDPSEGERARIDLAMRFQQYTAPLSAKGIEDTAFYRYQRLIALNEVGGDPAHFGHSVAAFHQENLLRSRHRPHGMLTTATHDTKRGEDARVRIAVLSEMPHAWESSVRKWAQLNARRRVVVDGSAAPDRNDEYFIYQTLVGSWPLELFEESDLSIAAEFLGRLEVYLVKALREAKRHSSWARPNEAYESATLTFARRILDRSHRSPFIEDFSRFVHGVARFGMYNGLTQTVLRVMGPGVPDTYQGCEFWDLSFVDPDNRRPVDYGVRARRLAALRESHAKLGGKQVSRELLDTWTDGSLKLYVMWRLLSWRRANPEAFEAGAYRPVEVSGRFSEHLCAFAMRQAIVVVPRLVARMLGSSDRQPLGEAWEDTALLSPNGVSRYVDVLGGGAIEARAHRLAVADVLRYLPIAVLEPA